MRSATPGAASSLRSPLERRFDVLVSTKHGSDYGHWLTDAFQQEHRVSEPEVAEDDDNTGTAPGPGTKDSAPAVDLMRWCWADILHRSRNILNKKHIQIISKESGGRRWLSAACPFAVDDLSRERVGAL